MTILNFELLEGNYTIHQIDPGGRIPLNIFGSGFFSITKTAEELSIVCLKSIEIDDLNSSPDWSCMKLTGPLDLSLTGVLANISKLLSDAEIPIFVISTYNTDYILVERIKTEKAIKTLKSAGHYFFSS